MTDEIAAARAGYARAMDTCEHMLSQPMPEGRRAQLRADMEAVRADYAEWFAAHGVALD